MTRLETAPEFAARFWGGEGCRPVQVPATWSRSDIDGGKYRIPAGWAFSSDGFGYRLYEQEPDRWLMEASDGAFATIHQGPTAFCVGRELNRRWEIHLRREVP